MADEVLKEVQAVPDYAERIKRERELRNWTQEQLAEKVGIDPRNVNRWEHGKTFPHPLVRDRLCELFGKSAEELGLVVRSELIWNVPYRRNPFFTAREDVLEDLREALTSSEARTKAFTQPLAISGLGGIGKTQTAVEYAYRHRDDYQAVLWLRADSREVFMTDSVNIAGLLNLPERKNPDQSRLVDAFRRWLQNTPGWLLILDNVEDLAMVSDFLPQVPRGHILLTTRTQVMGRFAQRVALKTMAVEDGARLLLRRARFIERDDPLDNVSHADWERAMTIAQLMGGLPLALDQAGAYIEDTESSLAEYVDLYKKERSALLRMRGGLVPDHPEPVDATMSLAFKKVEQANAAAADLLRLCAFLHPDAIPEEIITEGASELGSALQAAVAAPLQLKRAIQDLRKYSLVRRDPKARLLNIHRLVQAVLRDEMKQEEQRLWAERAVRAVNRAFPEGEAKDLAAWERSQRCLPHAQVCAALIDTCNFIFPEAAHLLHRTANYLDDHGQYARAETLYQRALAIREQALAPEHPDTAATLNNLACLYQTQSRYAEAEALFQRALAINEKVLEPDHPHTAFTLNNLASLHQEQGRYAEAEALFQRALAINEKEFGPDHFHAATNLNNLAELYRLQDRYVQAEPLYQRALAIYEKMLGPEHPYTATVLDNLAQLYSKQGAYALAEDLSRQALAVYEKKLGEAHPLVAENLERLTDIYYAQGKYAEAEPLIGRAQAIREQTLEADHPEIAKCYYSLGLLYLAQGKYPEAERLFQRTLAIWEQKLGSEHPNVMTLLEHYAELLRKMQRETEAAELAARAKGEHS